jgi:hypothetical protein
MAGQLITRHPYSGSWRTLHPGVDRLAFTTGLCRLRTPFGDDLGVGQPVAWANGVLINRSTCCEDHMLVKAEWWRVARLVEYWPVKDAVLPGVAADRLWMSATAREFASFDRNRTCVPLHRQCGNATVGVRATTVLGSEICVAASCGTPTDSMSMSGCGRRPGGRAQCCAGFIQRYGPQCCGTEDVGCVLKRCVGANKKLFCNQRVNESMLDDRMHDASA